MAAKKKLVTLDTGESFTPEVQTITFRNVYGKRAVRIDGDKWEYEDFRPPQDDEFYVANDMARSIVQAAYALPKESPRAIVTRVPGTEPVGLPSVVEGVVRLLTIQVTHANGFAYAGTKAKVRAENLYDEEICELEGVVLSDDSLCSVEDVE